MKWPVVKGDFLKWGFWGKMCCKAPGGKYAQFRKVEKRKIEKWKDFVLNFEKSKSPKAKSRKVKRCLCEFQKVEKYTF
jgi:hypothetical protein